MRSYGKPDATHRELLPLLRAHGASVLSLTAVGKGAPDALVGFHGVDVLVEFKADRGRVQDNQREWHQLWRGHRVRVVRTADDVRDLLDAMAAEARGRATTAA